MSRVTDTLIVNKAYNQTDQPMINLEIGGQFGYAPDYKTWLSSQSYVRQNLIAKLITVPSGFTYLPDSERWVATLKQLIEVQAERIEGLRFQANVETEETPLGFGNEKMEEITDVTMEPSQATFTWKERYGSPVSQFWYNYISYLMKDPIVKRALIGTLSDVPGDALADLYSFSALFFEPDPTHRYVQRAWLGGGMYPKTSGDIEGMKAPLDPGETKTFTIEMAGFYQYGENVRKLAQEQLDKMNIQGANPFNTPAFVDGVDPDIEAANNGYNESIEKVKDNT